MYYFIVVQQLDHQSQWTSFKTKNVEMEEVEDDASLGCCEGVESMYIRLISSDGHEFVIERKYAFVSTTIQNMLGCPGQFVFYLSVNFSRALFLFKRYFFNCYPFKNKTVTFYCFGTQFTKQTSNNFYPKFLVNQNNQVTMYFRKKYIEKIRLTRKLQ